MSEGACGRSGASNPLRVAGGSEQRTGVEVLGIELRSSSRTGNTLNHPAISPAPKVKYF